MSLKRKTRTGKQNLNDVRCPSHVEHTPENKPANDVQCPSNVELTPENKTSMMFNVPQT